DKKQGLGFLDYVAGAGKRLALPWTGIAGLRLTGMKLYEVYGSVQNQLEVAKQMEDRFAADFTGIMDDGIILSETLGMKIKVYDYDFPAVQEHGVKTREALARLKMPDPLAGGRIKTNIQAIEALAKISEKPLAISIEGPFTLAAQLAGVEDLARAIIADPDFVRLLLKFTAGAVKRYAQAVSRAGADLVSIAEPTSIILSPQQFKTFVAPGLQKVFQDLTAWKVLHICGDTSHLLDLILSCGMEGLSLDQVMDIPAVMKKIPENIVFSEISIPWK
nr:methyltransferase [Desulfobacula sp.]